MSTSVKTPRVVSGMRTTGRLHLGHYHGVLKNWEKLQHEYDCLFFAADWHALTTHYEDPSGIEQHTWDMLIDWLAAGINPNAATLFIQSQVPEHAELHLLLSMLTPLSWLERMPSYKDQQLKLKDKDLSTYGFLGYPLLQSADILVYGAEFVPVGEDQAPHVELTREVARRFNHLYGRDPNFAEAVEQAIAKMGRKPAKLYRECLKGYQERGEQELLEKGQAVVEAQQNLSLGDKERLSGHLEGSGRAVLTEPQCLLTETPKLPGLDGQKMSKSYGNIIWLREEPDAVEKKIRTMQTDPARVRRDDPGEPEKCPVWSLHQLYADDNLKEWVQTGCRQAKIGCLDCKKPLIDAIRAEQAPIIERGKEYEGNPSLVRSIVAEGCEKARATARETMETVREVMGLKDL